MNHDQYRISDFHRRIETEDFLREHIFLGNCSEYLRNVFQINSNMNNPGEVETSITFYVSLGWDSG